MAAPPYCSGTVMPSTPRVAHLAPQVHGELVVAVNLGRAGRDFGLGKVAHGVAQGVDVFAQLEVEARKVGRNAHGVCLLVEGMEMGRAQPWMLSRPVTAIRVQPMVAISFSWLPSMAKARPFADGDGAAGLQHPPLHSKPLAFGRGQQD
jgi:hypothetical protein